MPTSPAHNPRPSIRDVAEKAGVSHTTASMALRGDPRISKATRLKVVEAAKALDYHPHALVSELMAQLRTLRASTERETLGFITAWPTRDGWMKLPNHRRFFNGVESHARQMGYKVEVFWLREQNMNSRRMSQILRNRGIRGIILQALPHPHGHLSLQWQHFAAVTKGLTIVRPRLHRVISSHFEDMRLVTHQLRRMGYRRPGLALSRNLDLRVDHAWLAAYLLMQHDLPEPDRIPAIVLDSDGDTRLLSEWYGRHKPEVILFTGLPVEEWTRRVGLRVPEVVGLVHLDWSSEYGGLAGVNANAEAMGAAVVDLLAGQLYAHEYGIPEREKIVAVNGTWVPGPSVRQQRALRQ